MIFVPLPFVVAALLAVLLARMLRGDGEGRQDGFFVALVGAYLLQSVLIGLRWGYGIRAMLPVQSVLAAVIAALAFTAFARLAGGSGKRASRPALHAAPACFLVVLHLLGWGEAVAPALILVFLGYGLALLRLALAGPDVLAAARLDGAVRSYRALQATTGALLASAATDILISLDYALTGGVHSGAVVASANVLALLVLGGAASSVRPGRTPGGEGEDDDGADEPERSAPQAPSEEDRAVADRLDRLMRSTGLYKDAELNLNRIGRRLALPARRVSAAVNRVHGTSVSQYVNGLRIAEACRLLSSTADPVTKVMFEAGFLSKSNFNREFARETGASPTAWRRTCRPAPVGVPRGPSTGCGKPQ